MNNVITPDLVSLFNPPSTEYTLFDQHVWRSIKLLKMEKRSLSWPLCSLFSSRAWTCCTALCVQLSPVSSSEAPAPDVHPVTVHLCSSGWISPAILQLWVTNHLLHSRQHLLTDPPKGRDGLVLKYHDALTNPLLTVYPHCIFSGLWMNRTLTQHSRRLSGLTVRLLVYKHIFFLWSQIHPICI